MKKRDTFETILWAIAAIVMASIGVQYTEGLGRAIFCVLTFVLCIVVGYLLNCYIEWFGKRKQSNTNKGEA